MFYMRSQEEIINEYKEIIVFCKKCNSPIAVKGLKFPNRLILKKTSFEIPIKEKLCLECYNNEKRN